MKKMSILHVEFFSSILKRQVSFKAIIPLEKPESDLSVKREMRTLYLLHGYTGHCTDWLSGSLIHELSGQHDIAVIMPSGENSFYVDNAEEETYFGEFIGKEIVEFTRALFPLSHKREDTAIGGLSMGGYGAIRNGLKYCDIFGSVIALSSALITDGIADPSVDFTKTVASRKYYEKTFGKLDELPGSENDPKALAKRVVEDRKPFPNLYMACGTEDFLLNENRDFKEYLQSLGVRFTYRETAGAHDWKFWNPQIEYALDWLDKIYNCQGI